jgi:quercetin dioxygenase-like cupin family protein
MLDPPTFATATPWALPRRQQQPDWTLPRAREVGFIRAKCTPMHGTALSAGVVMILTGQTTPLHSSNAEHIIFQLDGEVAFEIEGERYALESRDMLFIPADAPYSYTNTGRDTATFISIIANLDSLPPKSTYYDKTPPPRGETNDSSGPPSILKSRDQQPTWTLPRADTVGFLRAKCNGMDGTWFNAGVVFMPIGQTTPLHSSNAEHIIYLLEGEIEFTIESEPYPMLPGDMLFIPANAKYVYTNMGREQAAFITVLSKVDSWPHTGTYYD